MQVTCAAFNQDQGRGISVDQAKDARCFMLAFYFLS